MIHELRTYTLPPGAQAKYLQLSGDVGRKIRGDKYGKQEGFWFTEFGTLNQLVHLWSFRDLKDRAEARARLAKEPAWQDFLGKANPLLAHMQAIVLMPAPFSAMR